MKLSEKMWLIILKVTKKTGFHSPFRRYIFGKNHRGGRIDTPPSFFRVNLLILQSPNLAVKLIMFPFHLLLFLE